MKNVTLLQYGRVTHESAFAIFAFDSVVLSPEDPVCYDVYLLALCPGRPRGWTPNGSLLLESRQLEEDLPVKVEDMADAAAHLVGAQHLVARRVGELIERDAQAKRGGAS